MLSDIKKDFIDNGNIITKLIIINVVVFVIVGLTSTYFQLSKLEISGRFFEDWLGVHSKLDELISKPWTLVTYMFMHSRGNFFHIIFNMLILYWFGTYLADFIGNKRILPIFITGGICGAILFVLAYNLIPMFNATFGELIGASAGVMAILFAMATLRPNMQIRLILLGQVSIKYIALVLLIVDLISLSGSNGGGSFSHVGGAAFGFVYIKMLQRGVNLGYWVEYIQAILRGDRRSKMKVDYKKPVQKSFSGKPDPKEFSRQDKIDRILDKISKSGYSSLNAEEKDYLFKYSKEN